MIANNTNFVDVTEFPDQAKNILFPIISLTVRKAQFGTIVQMK